DFAVEQVGDGGEPDMRVRPHVDAVAGLEHRRAEMVEKDERADHARAARRQRAMHLEAAEIDRAWHDHLRDSVARLGIAEARVFAGEKAHDALLVAKWPVSAKPRSCRQSLPSHYCFSGNSG